jgi:hypothetical protein
VIWESGPWKDDLLRLAASLNRYRRLKRWSQKSDACVERLFMHGFYSIRKLVDAHKVSDEIVQRPIRLGTFPSRGKVVTQLNWVRIEDKYDLANLGFVDRSLQFVSNQFVHSYVFVPVIGETGGLDSVLFNSDYTRSHSLFSLDVGTVADLFREIGLNYPSCIYARFDGATGDYRVSVGRGETFGAA